MRNTDIRVTRNARLLPFAVAAVVLVAGCDDPTRGPKCGYTIEAEPLDLTGHPIQGDLADLGKAKANLPDDIGFAATLTDDDGDPVEGILVQFGSLGSATTNANGRAFQPANMARSAIPLKNSPGYSASIEAGLCKDPYDEAPIIRDW